MVIQKNKMNLFAPKNIADNMCFSICLAHFLNPHCPDQELIRIAKNIHTDLGYEPQDKIAFHDVSKFETALDLKIVIFHRSSSGELVVYTNADETHQNNVHLYLHEEHYYMIKNLKGLLGYGMSASIAIKDLTIVVYIIVNLHVTYAIRLSATRTPRNGYSAMIARGIADLSSVMKYLNNRKVTVQGLGVIS